MSQSPVSERVKEDDDIPWWRSQESTSAVVSRWGEIRASTSSFDRWAPYLHMSKTRDKKRNFKLDRTYFSWLGSLATLRCWRRPSNPADARPIRKFRTTFPGAGPWSSYPAGVSRHSCLVITSSESHLLEIVAQNAKLKSVEVQNISSRYIGVAKEKSINVYE